MAGPPGRDLEGVMPHQREWHMAIRRMEQTIALLDKIAARGLREAIRIAAEVQGARDKMVIRFREAIRVPLTATGQHDFSGLADGVAMFHDVVKSPHRPPR